MKLVAAVKKVKASLVTGTAPNETVDLAATKKAIKASYDKAPQRFIAEVYYQQHLITLANAAGTGKKATTQAAAAAAGYNEVGGAASAAGKEVAYWLANDMRKAQLSTLLAMYETIDTAITADVALAAGKETNLNGKLTTYTPALTKKNFVDAIAETTAVYTLAGADNDKKYLDMFVKLRADSANKAANTLKIAKRVATNYFKANTFKAANQSSGYRIQNYTYATSPTAVAATTGFPNTWDAASILATYEMDPADAAKTGADIAFHRSNIVIGMNEYVPTCHYAALDVTHFTTLTTSSGFAADRAKMIALTAYDTPAKACGQLAKLKLKVYGWLEAAYSADTSATITAAATMDALFCTATAGIDTYAKFNTNNLYSSADFMQVINVSRIKKVAGTSNALA